MSEYQIIADACAAYGVSLCDFHGGNRRRKHRKTRTHKTRAVVLARRDVFRALSACGWSTPRIGRLCGVDHTAVVRGRRKG